MNPALIVFAKVPVAGQVKTRLTPVLRDDEAADLYRAFLFDALDLYSTLEASVRLYVDSGVASRDRLRVDPGVASRDPLRMEEQLSVTDQLRIPDTIGLFEQAGNGLGERMAHAFAETFDAGFDRVAIVGTDHPTLPPAFISYAFKSISSPKSIAIGPADDGGYYLLAMNEFVPEVFYEMSYSHSDVFDDTLYRVAAAGAVAIVLPVWYDVDTPSELRRLRADLAKSDTLAPRTRRQLDQLATRYRWL